MARTTTRPTRDGRRSYGHFCGLARALDQVGDRWAMLIVRELLGGPRRYTDLHADLPGASTDMLAARLRDLESDAILERRPLPAPASGSVYALTARGEALAPALAALAAWGAAELSPRRSTDAVRAHWHALPTRDLLRRHVAAGTVDVVTDEGTFHLRLDDPAAGEPLYGPERAEHADGELALPVATLTALCRGEDLLPAAVAQQRVDGSAWLLAALAATPVANSREDER